MKKLVFLLLFINFAVISKATHEAGAAISWECIAPNQYKIKLTLFCDCAGIACNFSQTNIGFVNNFGKYGGVITLYALPNGQNPLVMECSNLKTYCNGGTFSGFRRSEFEGIFDLNVLRDNSTNLPYSMLPDSVQEWRLYYESCCRVFPLANMQSNTLFVDALLINKRFHNQCNNSPEIGQFFQPNFCLKNKVNIDINYEEPDADSLVYELVPALDNYGTATNYIAPFTGATPLPAIPFTPQGIKIDKNGTISFNPDRKALLGTYQVVVKCSEYRNGNLIGWTKFDFPADFSLANDICSNITPTFALDTLELPCGTANFNVKINTDVQCNTIASNGSDFRLSNKNGFGAAIDSIFPLTCNSSNETSEIKIKLYQGLTKNGWYYLYSKNGSDGNTLVQKCNRAMNQYDSLYIFVRGCNEEISGQLDTVTKKVIQANEISNTGHVVTRYQKTYTLTDFKLYAQNGDNNIASIIIYDNLGRVVANSGDKNIFDVQWEVFNSATYIYKTTYKDGSFEIGRIIN
jgi:hypothetical protein